MSLNDVSHILFDLFCFVLKYMDITHVFPWVQIAFAFPPTFLQSTSIVRYLMFIDIPCASYYSITIIAAKELILIPDSWILFIFILTAI